MAARTSFHATMGAQMVDSGHAGIENALPCRGTATVFPTVPTVPTRHLIATAIKMDCMDAAQGGNVFRG